MAFYPPIERWEYVVYDTETDGLQWWKNKAFGASICSPEGEGFYYDFRVQPGSRSFLRDMMPKVNLVVGHHLKFDFHMSRQLSIHLPQDRLYCTMIAAALANEHELEYGLEYLAAKYTEFRKDTSIYKKLADIFGGRPTAPGQGPNFHRAPAELIGPYAIDDVRATRGLYTYTKSRLVEDDLEPIMALEMRLLPAIVRMEQRGVRIDVEAAQDASKAIAKQITLQQTALNKEAGFEINPNPSNSIKQLFKPTKNDAEQWVLVDGTICENTDAGAASIDADCLRKMKHPAASMILKLRKAKRVKDVFLDGHVLGNHHNGIVHCNMNQTRSDNDMGTESGRMSINDPALQQIPMRDRDTAEIVRTVFIPDPGFDWVCNDWHQMDFRVFAHYVKNPALLKAYTDDPNTDFHQLAANITGLPRSPRYAGDANAKQINLGLVFGMGQGKLAWEMGLPYTQETDRRGKVWLRPGQQAMDVFTNYHRAIPGIKDMLENASSVAKSRGYVRTILGRRIRFPNGHFTHKAGGLIFQGTAADALKVKIIQLDEYFETSKGEHGSLRLNVHDEFDSYIPEGDERGRMEVSRIVTDFHSESQSIKFRVPILTDQGVGSTWWEASK